MEESDKITLEKICKTRGWKSPSDDTAFMLFNYINEELGLPEAERWLLGFLRSRETLIAVFGDRWHFNFGKMKDIATCRGCGDICNWHREKPHEFDADWKYCWQHHDYQMSGLSALECLRYFGQFLKHDL